METDHETEILLVEDNKTDAELTIRALRKHNLANKLLWLKDGAEALEFIFDEEKLKNNIASLKLLLLDLKLPKVDGMEVLKKIKSDERTKIIPVVVFTSSKEDKDIYESYKLGVNSFISKPVEFENFFKVISELGQYWLLINKPPL